MTFYFSCRPFVIDRRLITPKYQFENGFKGLNIEFKNICSGNIADSRWLYQCNVSDEYTESDQIEIKNVVLEALSAWGIHEKSLDSAAELAQKLTGVKWKIKKNEIEIEEKQKLKL